MADTLPSANDFFGAQQPDQQQATPPNAQLPSADDFFKQDNDQSNQNLLVKATGRGLGAFVDNMKQTGFWGTSEETKEIMGHSPEEDAKHGFYSAPNIFTASALRGLALPAWHVFEASMAGAEAALRSATTPITQIGNKMAGIKRSEDEEGIGLDELFETTGYLPPGEFMGIPHVALPPPVLRGIAEGELGVSEAVATGVREPTSFQRANMQAAAESYAKAQRLAEPPRTIHEAADQAAPEVMTRYRVLEDQRDNLRDQITEAAQRRDEEAVMTLNPVINDLQTKVQEAEARGAKTVYSDILNKKLAERDEALATARQQDSGEMATLRRQLQETDYKMRDLAPDVSAAYRKAEGMMPKPAEAIAAPEAKAETAVPTTEHNLVPIVQDMSKKLTGAGRPQEEADAAAQLVAEHYKARAERFDGQLGTPEEMYHRDMADVRVGKQRAIPEKGRMLAQSNETLENSLRQQIKELNDPALPSADKLIEKAKKGQLSAVERRRMPSDILRMADELQEGGTLYQKSRGNIRLATGDAKAMITMMRDANASTFIHETGHHWLDELLRDAQHELAPADLKTDAATVRKWLGVQEGESIPTRAHEKFARGFERYLMEGTAPSRVLANVFQKFKQWLTSIYKTVDKLRAPINDDIRDVFSRLLSSKPERTVIAPEREPPSIHELAAERAPEGVAPGMVAGTRGAVERMAGIHDEEAANAIRASELGVRGAGVEGAPSGAGETAGETPRAEAPPRPGEHVQGRTDLVRKGAAPSPEATAKPLKNPVLSFLKERGGIKRGSPLDKELKAMGNISPKWYAKKGEGLGDVDNIPLNEWRAKLDEGKDDGNGYVDRQYALDAIRDELSGNPIGMRDLLAEHAHDTDYWEHWAEEQSKDDQAHAAKEIEDYQKDQITKMEEAREERLALSGQKEEYSETRSLEDIENELKEENAANKLRAGEARPERPAGGTEGEGGGPEGGGFGGGTPQYAGRAEAPTRGEPTSAKPRRPGEPAGEQKPTERPRDAGPNAPFDRTESRLVDKAGNIRLDNLNTTEDWKNALREAAGRNNDFLEARRGVLTDRQVLNLADSLGVDPSFIDRRAVGEAFNAEEMKATERALAESTAKIRAAMERLSSEQSEEAAIDYQKTVARHDMIQSTYSGILAEAGRALRAARKNQSYWNQGDIALNQFIEDVNQNGDGSPKTLNQLIEEAKYGSKLQTPAQLAKFMRDSKRDGFQSKIGFYFVNSLLSGPFTHARYAIGNFINAILRPTLEIPLASAFGKVMEVIKGEEAAGGVYAKEAAAQIYAMGKGSRDGLKAFRRAYLTGELPGRQDSLFQKPYLNTPNPIGGKLGEIIGQPVKIVQGIHAFFLTVRYEQNIAGLAVRRALDEGLEGKDFDTAVAKYSNSPPNDMMDAAMADAKTELYLKQKDYNSFTNKLSRLSDSNLPAKTLVPFVRININMAENAYKDHSLLGLFSRDVRANLFGTNGAAARDMQAAKIMAGTAVMGTVIGHALEGNMTGNGPIDPKLRQTWLLTHQPYSIKVGNTWISYKGWGYWGMLMMAASNMAETYKYWDSDNQLKNAVALTEGVARSVEDQNFMLGISRVLDAMEEPQQFGARFLKSYAENWTPFSVGVGQINRAFDPYMRDTRGIMDAVETRLPFGEHGLPLIDMFGNPIKNGSKYDQYTNDPVVKQLEALHTGVGRLERKINHVDLTERQFFEYSQLAGKNTWMMLHLMVGQPGFVLQPPGEQRLQIDRAIEQAREMARTAIKLKYPEIMQQAIANKEALFSSK